MPDASGEQFLVGLIVAYEVLCRLADSVVLRARGWDSLTLVPIATCLGAAKMLELDGRMMSEAVSMAVISSPLAPSNASWGTFHVERPVLANSCC